MINTQTAIYNALNRYINIMMNIGPQPEICHRGGGGLRLVYWRPFLSHHRFGRYIFNRTSITKPKPTNKY